MCDLSKNEQLKMSIFIKMCGLKWPKNMALKMSIFLKNMQATKKCEALSGLKTFQKCKA